MGKIPEYQNIATTLLYIVVYNLRFVPNIDSLQPFRIDIWISRCDSVHHKSLA
jgi:hypothetical protein